MLEFQDKPELHNTGQDVPQRCLSFVESENSERMTGRIRTTDTVIFSYRVPTGEFLLSRYLWVFLAVCERHTHGGADTGWGLRALTHLAGMVTGLSPYTIDQVPPFSVSIKAHHLHCARFPNEAQVCPLWVKSGHMQCTNPCPLYPQ
jgi:hypothetical protein